jgi:Aldo/keto reductase family
VKAGLRIGSSAVVEKYQIGVIPCFSLAAGVLTGKYRSQQDMEKASRGSMVQKYLNDSGFAVVAALDEVANAHESTPPRVALAWLLAQPGITAPIVSTTNEKQLADLAEAAKLKLGAESIRKLDEASARKVGQKLWPDRGCRFTEGVVRFFANVSQNRTLGATLYVQVRRLGNQIHALAFRTVKQ